MKLLVGLSTLPRTLSLEDPRLPWIELTNQPLRLNTHPIPANLLAETPPDHTSRVAAITRWLQSQADPWSATLRNEIAAYTASLTTALTLQRAELNHRLARYDGLYHPEDYLWSALRPLPRAWLVQAGAAPRFTDISFWDGDTFRFWRQGWPTFQPDERLPSSPFRRKVTERRA